MEVNIRYLFRAITSTAFSTLTPLVRHQEEHPAFKKSAMKCWRGYLCTAKCKQFAYGPADATATPLPFGSLKIQIGLTFLVHTYKHCRWAQQEVTLLWCGRLVRLPWSAGRSMSVVVLIRSRQLATDVSADLPPVSVFLALRSVGSTTSRRLKSSCHHAMPDMVHIVYHALEQLPTLSILLEWWTLI